MVPASALTASTACSKAAGRLSYSGLSACLSRCPYSGGPKAAAGLSSTIVSQPMAGMPATATLSAIATLRQPLRTTSSRKEIAEREVSSLSTVSGRMVMSAPSGPVKPKVSSLLSGCLASACPMKCRMRGRWRSRSSRSVVASPPRCTTALRPCGAKHCCTASASALALGSGARLGSHTKMSASTWRSAIAVEEALAAEAKPVGVRVSQKRAPGRYT
mmetsp:Transcript_19668/g.49592  ORF Transcript_19668/g.49592 Transcript_19668/m.49592 type:complete len:217 (+) Transcript_19668:1729-2379(+)